ncbi:hypothetical protein K2173_007614 [Erythroxylum novogranatense]|uniref:Uncharacterized protein n=1 Tax=Erythroxylum novogranatense TaxID=1862640 RepID=A0AAV8S958_9ROSI|nr:hypothetical protein K2173_007614 [Erythroxylum novogranatense]
MHGKQPADASAGEAAPPPPTNGYGPWTLVQPRAQRLSQARQAQMGRQQVPSAKAGSRFTPLSLPDSVGDGTSGQEKGTTPSGPFGDELRPQLAKSNSLRTLSPQAHWQRQSFSDCSPLSHGHDLRSPISSGPRAGGGRLSSTNGRDRALDSQTGLEPNTSHHSNDPPDIVVDSVATDSPSALASEQSVEPPQPGDDHSEAHVGGTPSTPV